MTLSLRPLRRFRRSLPLAAIGLMMTAALSACAGTGNGSSAASPAAQPPNSPAAPPAVLSNAVAPPAATNSLPASSGSNPNQEHLVGLGSETVLTVHGKIVSVNRAKKQVTLEGPDGKKVTVNVYNPYNLAAAKPGEPFVAKFYEIVTVRKTNPGEVQPSASVAEGVISASPGQTPGAVVGHGVQLVVTVEAINRELETITVKAADGTEETVHVSNPDNLKHLKVGDGIVVTLWKVVAVALEKESSQR